LFRPPAVWFRKENDVWLEFSKEAAIDIDTTVLHEDIGGDESEVGRAWAGKDLFTGEASVRADLEELSGKGGSGECQKRLIVRGKFAKACEVTSRACQCGGTKEPGGESELEAREIEGADCPMA
jgi:hypothetical protein